LLLGAVYKFAYLLTYLLTYGQGHETIIFGGQEVKCQGHMRPNNRCEGLVEASLSTAGSSSLHLLC